MLSRDYENTCLSFFRRSIASIARTGEQNVFLQMNYQKHWKLILTFVLCLDIQQSSWWDGKNVQAGGKKQFIYCL